MHIHSVGEEDEVSIRTPRSQWQRGWGKSTDRWIDRCIYKHK